MSFKKDIRVITEKDLEICQCNPIRHKYIPEIYNAIYSMGTSDIWHCNNCSEHGDKWVMIVHNCKPYYRSLYEEEIKEPEDKVKLNNPNEELNFDE